MTEPAGDHGHPFDRVVCALQHRQCRVVMRGCDSARATCPAHPDARPSLSITKRPDRALLRCFAGCRFGAILSALNLKAADLFLNPARRGRSVVVAEYDYVDLNGVVVATKIRFEPKGFRWRTGTRWGLHGADVGLYRFPDLIESKQVLVTEGERAVDRLWSLKLPATCPPAGASSWRLEWSAELWRAGSSEVIVLADADQAGRLHARRVAASCYQHQGIQFADAVPIAESATAPWETWPNALPSDPEVARLAVKLLELPGLRHGGDVVDFLDAGATASDLRTLIAATPLWTPDGDERQRRERQRALTRERVRRFREARRQPKASVAHAA